LRQSQGKDSGQGSKTKGHVKSEIQDKEEHLRQCQGKDPGQGNTLGTMSRQRYKTRKHT